MQPYKIVMQFYRGRLRALYGVGKAQAILSAKTANQYEFSISEECVHAVSKKKTLRA